MKKVVIGSTVALVTALAAWPTFWGRVSAQVPPPGTGGGSLVVVSDIEPRLSGWRRYPFVYSVKFVCGTVAASAGNPQLPADTDAPAVPGTYLTEINIFNRSTPGIVGPSAALYLLAAAAVEPEAEAPPVNAPEGEFVAQNRVIKIDCEEIYRLLGTSGTAASPFVTGYLSIYSNVEVEVAAVYTTKT